MDAVGADQGSAFDRGGLSIFPAFEGRHDTILMLVEADQPAPGMDPGRPQPVEHRAMENALQLAAMNGELGHIVSGVGATQFLPHRLAEAIAIEQLASPDADAVELRQQTELRQNADGVRQHVEADAEFAQLRGLLEYLGLYSGLVQREGGGKAADTAADDQDFLAQDYSSNRLRADCSGGQRVLDQGRGARTGQAA